MYGISNFIQSARETYLGDYATKKRTAPTEEDIFHLTNEEDTQFDDKFAEQVNEVENLIDTLEKETGDVMSNNTKTQLKEKVTSLLTKLNTIDDRLVLSERTKPNVTSYYERFKQVLINKVREDSEEELSDEVIASMETFFQMSFAPLKMMMETMLTDPAQIEELFERIETKPEDYVPSLGKPKSQIIEVPNLVEEEPRVVHMTEVSEPKPTRTNRSSKAKDPALGE